MSKLMDLKGKEIGGMRVVRQSGSETQGAGDTRAMWLCKCIRCGADQIITARYLQRRIRKDFVTKGNLRCPGCSAVKV